MPYQMKLEAAEQLLFHEQLGQTMGGNCKCYIVEVIVLHRSYIVEVRVLHRSYVIEVTGLHKSYTVEV